MTGLDVPTGPFSGLVVIDFTHVLAGPACAYYLGLLGAEVIKVESPKGEAMRHRGGTDPARAADGQSTAFQAQAAGKASVVLDLDSEEGRAAMDDLLSRADVLVENHLPDTLKRIGLHESQTCVAHPQLIHCAMTGYGRGGPQENAPAYDVNIQAASGLMEMTGTAESGPTRTGAPIVDYSTALAAAFAISAALYQRTQTGQGSFVDVSMMETAFTLMGSTITDYLATDNAPQRRGNLANSRSPGAGTFPCRTGYISLGVNEDSQFVALAHGLGRAHWLEEGRFATRDARTNHAQVLEAEMSAVLATRDAADWEEILQDAGVPCAMLRSLPDALAMPHTQARGYLHRPEAGLTTPTLPFRIGAKGPHYPSGPVAALGADTARMTGKTK